MSTNNIYIGTLNDHSQDHSKHVTVNVPAGTDIASIVRAAFAEEVEPAQEQDPEQVFFCRITQEAYDKGKAPKVEADLRSACVSAPKLTKAIRTNEALGYLDTKDLPSTDLYDLLNEHYHLPFKLRTFQDNRGK